MSMVTERLWSALVDRYWTDHEPGAAGCSHAPAVLAIAPHGAVRESSFVAGAGLFVFKTG